MLEIIGEAHEVRFPNLKLKLSHVRCAKTITTSSQDLSLFANLSKVFPRSTKQHLLVTVLQFGLHTPGPRASKRVERAWS
jgi:hypothetical protein